MSPQARREAVTAMRAKTWISERRACVLIGLSRTVLHYEQRRGWEKVETHFDGSPSGITHDDTEYTVKRTSNNCGSGQP